MKLVHAMAPTHNTYPASVWASPSSPTQAPHGADALTAHDARIAKENRELENRIHRLLGESGYFQLRSVACCCEDKTAFLSGQIPSFYLKQTAQEIVRRIEGIEHIQNRLEVVVPK